MKEQPDREPTNKHVVEIRCAECDKKQQPKAYSVYQLLQDAPVCRTCLEEQRKMKFRRRAAAIYKPKEQTRSVIDLPPTTEETS